jgi:hypothetical protein
VGDDDGRPAVGECVGEDFARMHGAAVDQHNRHDPDIQNLVRTVDANERFQRQIALMVGRRTWCGQSGRPKKHEPDADQLDLPI